MISTEFGPLGLPLILATYIPSFGILFMRLRSNIPENIPNQSYRSAIMGKVFFAIFLSLLTGSQPAGVASFSTPLVNILSLLGQGYFISSMMFDFIFIVIFYRMEFYGALKPVVFNLPYIPFITFAAVLYALVEQERTVRRVEEDVMANSDGVELGYAVKLVRTIQKPVTGRDEMRVQKHYDIRPLPREVAVKYLPTVGERVFNPHILIAGSSGTGKTTTAYNLLTQLSGKDYPVLLIDVKGDYTQGLWEEGLIGSRTYLFDIQRIGIDPFQPIYEGERNSDLIEDLMDSISVLEEVGSKQAHFLRTVYNEMIHDAGKPTYEDFTKRLEKMQDQLLNGKLHYGPQTRDAIMGIIDKCLDLSTVFKSDGVNLKHVATLLSVDKPSIAILNISNIPEKIRAIVMEFILRKLSKLMTVRGPLAYLKNRTVILAVDEAYLVAKPIMTRSGRGDTSKSKLEDIARAGRSYGLALILITQRLDDIADGIRQNFYRWIVFSTSSPRDTMILSAVTPEPIQRIINELPTGYAYIRMPNPRRLDMYRFTADTTALTDGYIFRMERRLLSVEDKDEEGAWIEDVYGLQTCGTCGVSLTERVKYCPVCGSDPTAKKHTIKETVKVAVNGSTTTAEIKPENNMGQQPVKDSEIGAVKEARKTLVSELKKEGRIEEAGNIESIPLEILIKTYRGEEVDDTQLIKYGLVERKSGRLRSTNLGKRLLKLLKKGDVNDR